MKNYLKMFGVVLLLFLAVNTSLIAQRGMRNGAMDSTRLKRSARELDARQMRALTPRSDSVILNKRGYGKNGMDMRGFRTMPPQRFVQRGRRNDIRRGEFYGSFRFQHSRGNLNYDRMGRGHSGHVRPAFEAFSDLTDSQKEEIASIRQKQQEEMKKVREEMMSKMEAIRNEYRTSILNQLSDEQKKLLDKNQDSRSTDTGKN